MMSPFCYTVLGQQLEFSVHLCSNPTGRLFQHSHSATAIPAETVTFFWRCPSVAFCRTENTERGKNLHAGLLSVQLLWGKWTDLKKPCFPDTQMQSQNGRLVRLSILLRFPKRLFASIFIMGNIATVGRAVVLSSLICHNNCPSSVFPIKLHLDFYLNSWMNVVRASVSSFPMTWWPFVMLSGPSDC